MNQQRNPTSANTQSESVVYKKLAELEQEITSLHSEIILHQQKTAQKISEVNETYERKLLEEKQRTLESTRAYNSMLSSNSWRLTAPARKLKNFLSKNRMK